VYSQAKNFDGRPFSATYATLGVGLPTTATTIAMRFGTKNMPTLRARIANE